MRFQETCCRGHDPKWAFSLSSTLRTERDGRHVGVDLRDMAGAWANDLADSREPASWRVARRLVAKGAVGIAVPSFANGARPDMSNLVLWAWTPDLPHRVGVHDPDGLLPKDQSSWRAPND